jgi:hypothetical protein
MFLNFRVCGYASFIYCKKSYDTPEARYRPFVYSFLFDSNVKSRVVSEQISQASSHDVEMHR